MDPSNEATFTVTCAASKEGICSEKIYITGEKTDPTKNVLTVELKNVGVAPKIDFYNFASIFRDCSIVEDVAEKVVIGKTKL